jgi:hypothetical protein
MKNISIPENLVASCGDASFFLDLGDILINIHWPAGYDPARIAACVAACEGVMTSSLKRGLVLDMEGRIGQLRNDLAKATQS